MTLPLEFEQFAEACVRDGRYESVSAVAEAGLRLLRAQEGRRADLVASLEAARAEGEQNGFLTLDEVGAEITDLLRGSGDRPGR